MKRTSDGVAAAQRFSQHRKHVCAGFGLRSGIRNGDGLDQMCPTTLPTIAPRMVLSRITCGSAGCVRFPTSIMRFAFNRLPMSLAAAANRDRRGIHAQSAGCPHGKMNMKPDGRTWRTRATRWINSRSTRAVGGVWWNWWPSGRIGPRKNHRRGTDSASRRTFLQHVRCCGGGGRGGSERQAAHPAGRYRF